MLIVKTYLDRSGTHGIGLFAGQFIRQGTTVWEFNEFVDFKFDEPSWYRMRENLSHMSFEAIANFSYKEKGSYILCVDNAQFMNHSTTGDNILQNHDTDTMAAKRDIAQGEELLCDYFAYSDHDDHHIMKLLNKKE